MLSCHDHARILGQRFNKLKAERLPHVAVARIHGMASAFKRPAGKLAYDQLLEEPNSLSFLKDGRR